MPRDEISREGTDTAPRFEIVPSIYDARDRTRCGRCGMSFVIGSPAHSSAERCRCPECLLAFWSAGIEGRNIVVCGVEVVRDPPPAIGLPPVAGHSAVLPLPGRAAVRSVTQVETFDAALLKSVEIIDEGQMCCSLSHGDKQVATESEPCPASRSPAK